MDDVQKNCSPFGHDNDARYMQEALKLAQKAARIDEVPIGALVVNKHGQIIGRGYNMVEKNCTQTAHAELRALTQAGKKIGDWRLNDCWLYVTLQPCAMCMNSIKLSRIEGVVYGAESPLFGYHLDNNGKVSLYHRDTLQVIKGVEADNAALLLKHFFKQKRKHASG